MMYLKTVGWVANSVKPDQTPNPVASDLGLHYLSISILTVNTIVNMIQIKWTGTQQFPIKGSDQRAHPYILSRSSVIHSTLCMLGNFAFFVSCRLFLILTFSNWLCWGLMTCQPLRVILCRFPEKGRKEGEEIVEEMKERDREERGIGVKVK